MLSLLGFLRDDPNTIHTTHRNSDQNPFIKTTTDEVWRRRICYAEWKRKSDANPIGYHQLTVEQCNHFRRNGSVFARKFGANTVTLSQWKDVLNSAIPLNQIKTEWGIDISNNQQENITKDNEMESNNIQSKNLVDKINTQQEENQEKEDNQNILIETTPLELLESSFSPPPKKKMKGEEIIDIEIVEK